MNKGKKSFLNAVAAFLQIAASGVLGIIFNKIILESFGSVYNGINATITQIINSILIIEGGFTLASNVALFEPWGENYVSRINGILSATKKRFSIIGWIFLAISTIIAFLYPLTVKESVPYFFVVALMFTVLLPTAFNLGVSTTYRVVLMAEQKEYIISFISTITYVIGTLTAIFAVSFLNVSFFATRVIIMLYLFAGNIAIILYCKLKYRFISFKEKPLYDEIKGTKSVVALKLTSVIYTSGPIIVISMIPGSGLVLASIYAVYNSVLSAVQGVLNAIISAPRLSFGALFAEKNKTAISQAYAKYEMITFLGLSIILGTTTLLLLPFVSIYTAEIKDANYVNFILMVLMISKTYFETVHIPSGQMILMSGRFKDSNKIQIIACVVLSIILMVGVIKSSIYIVLSATLVAAVVLSLLEIRYTEKLILNRGVSVFLKNVCPSFLICVGCMFISKMNTIVCGTFFELIVLGVVVVSGVTLVSLLLHFIVNKDCLKGIFRFVFDMIFSKTRGS